MLLKVPDQLKTLTDIGEILDCVGDILNKNVIFGTDFVSFLEAHGGHQVLKKTLSEM